MRFHLFVVALMIIQWTGVVYADLPSDPEKYRKWEKESLDAIVRYREEGDLKAHTALATYIFALSGPFNREKEPRPVFQAAREALISFPDHAEYLKRHLEAAMEIEVSRTQGRPKPRIENLDFDRHQIFEVMQSLQTPAVVALLGEMLEDNRDPWRDVPRGDVGKRPVNSVHATEALNKIGIEGVPKISLETIQGLNAAREQWRLWFAQVKAGNRTFRFEGNSQEYDLRGPVRMAVSEPHVTKVGAAPATPATVASEEPRSRLWPLWVTLGVLAAGTAVYWGKRRPV